MTRLERGMGFFFLTKIFDGEITPQIKDHCHLVALRFTPRMREAGLRWKAVCSDVRTAGLRVKRNEGNGSSGSGV